MVQSTEPSRGFTLVELMVSVALVAIVMSYVGITLNSAPFRLKSAVHRLRAAMQQARLEAVKRNKDVYLDFDRDDNGRAESVSLWVSMDPGESSPTFDEGEDVLLWEDSYIAPSDSSAGGATYGAVPTDQGGPSSPAPAGASGSLPDDGISFNGNRINFNPDGTSSAGTIYLHVPTNPRAGTYAIVLNNNGRAYLRYFPTGGPSWEDR